MSSLAPPQADAATPASSATKPEERHAKVAIVDIRRNDIAHSIRNDMLEKLQPADGEEKKLPTILLYDEIGLKLFENITFLDDVPIHWRVHFC